MGYGIVLIIAFFGMIFFSGMYFASSQYQIENYTCLGKAEQGNKYGVIPQEGKYILSHEGYTWVGQYKSELQLVNFCQIKE